MNCTRCHEDKPDCSIHCRRTNKDGSVYTRYICRECRRARWNQNRVVIKRLPRIESVEKPPIHFNFRLDYNRALKRPVVCLPTPPKLSASLQKIVDDGRAKNLALMLKYK